MDRAFLTLTVLLLLASAALSIFFRMRILSARLWYLSRKSESFIVPYYPRSPDLSSLLLGAWSLELAACAFRKARQRLTYEGGRSSSAIVKYLNSDRLELSLIFFFIRCFKCIKDVILLNPVSDPDDWTFVQPIMELF